MTKLKKQLKMNFKNRTMENLKVNTLAKAKKVCAFLRKEHNAKEVSINGLTVLPDGKHIVHDGAATVRFSFNQNKPNLTVLL